MLQPMRSAGILLNTPSKPVLKRQLAWSRCYLQRELLNYRDVVWKPALEKVGLEYRPPIQTRHTFATMMLSEGEDPGWVLNMMGHASLQMIFTRYYAWIPKKTRRDGLAFMEAISSQVEMPAAKAASVDQIGPEKSGKVIHLFDKNDTITSHSTKKARSDEP